MTQSRAQSSTYLEWAKLHSAAPYNLATSGIQGYPLSELHLSIDDLEINGPTVYGYLPLQERLAKLSGVTPDHVVAANGTAMANHLAMAALIDAGDDVLVEQPTYGPMLEVPSYLRANILRFKRRAENGFQIHPDDIQRIITPQTTLIAITNLHNPSGALTSEETLLRIGEIAASVGARVLVDEVYLDMVEPPVRSSIHLGDQFVVTTSLTKAYGLSGLRCGWILAEPKLAHRMWRLDDIFGASPVHPSELISVKALDQLDRIAARAKKILTANRAALDAFLDSRADLTGFRSSCGTVAFPKLTRGSVDDFCHLLRAQFETSVVPGRFFEMPSHFRIGIGGDVAMTAEAFKRLGGALDAYALTLA